MKSKILIVIIVILILALFVETAYLFQLKSEISSSQKVTRELYKGPIQKFYRNKPEFDTLSPFEELNRIQKEFNKIFQDRFLFNFDLDLEDNFNDNRKDLYETEKEYIVKLNLPGLKKSKLNIEVKGNSLIVSAEENIKEEKEMWGMYSTTQKISLFQKIIPLPGSVKANEVKTEYKDGILTIILPKDKTGSLEFKIKSIVEL